MPSINVDGITVHLVDLQGALAAISAASFHEGSRPLGVVSINLDHVHHFGVSRTAARGAKPFTDSGGIEWLNLIDGAPIASRAQRETGRRYAKLSGSDLIVPVLNDASLRSRSVGILGGSSSLTNALMSRFERQWPGIRFAGHWTPEREQLMSDQHAKVVAGEINAADVDILLVCVGKPRQEEWINQFGPITGAGALLAFGAVVDFLAGRVSRAPAWVSRVGLEWAWRLLLEPRRLARRYLIQGPPAYLAVRRSSPS